MGGHQTEGAFGDDSIDDGETLIMHDSVVLPSDFHVRNTAAVGEEKENIFWRDLAVDGLRLRGEESLHWPKSNDE
jgi:hypothetical protein